MVEAVVIEGGRSLEIEGWNIGAAYVIHFFCF